MRSSVQILVSTAAAIGVFIAGANFGSRFVAAAAQSAKKPAPSAQTNHFGQPKTIIQVSLLKFRAGTSEAQKQEMLDGVRAMAGQIPGIKNIWLKTSRMQPRDFDAAFVIEFANRDAADDYALSPIHDAWSKKLEVIRETSLSPQITN